MQKPAGGLVWLIAGGLAYTLGVVFYAADGKIRHAHVIWHLFELLSGMPAVREVIREMQEGAQFEVHLANVQPGPTGCIHIYAAINPASMLDYEILGNNALAPAAQLLKDTGISHARHILWGADVAKALNSYAENHQMSRIIMGTHRHGLIDGLLWGSAALDVIDDAAIPVNVIPLDAATK